MKKVVVFIPKAGYGANYDKDFIESYIGAKNYLFSKIDEIPYQFSISEYFAHTFPIDANRNECVSLAVSNEIDYSIFFDTDHIIPHDTIYKLLKHDLPIVAGVYHGKQEPFHPIMFRENKEMSKDFDVFSSIVYYPETELFEADMTGAGCFIVSLDVLKKLKKPYFKYRPVPEILNADNSKEMLSRFDKELQEVYRKWMPTAKFKIENEVHDCSEDVWFWRNVRENTDYKLLIDPTIQLPHGPHRMWIDKGYAKAYLQMRSEEHVKKYGQKSFDEENAKICRVEPAKKKD